MRGRLGSVPVWACAGHTEGATNRATAWRACKETTNREAAAQPTRSIMSSGRAGVGLDGSSLSSAAGALVPVHVKRVQAKLGGWQQQRVCALHVLPARAPLKASSAIPVSCLTLQSLPNKPQGSHCKPCTGPVAHLATKHTKRPTCAARLRLPCTLLPLRTLCCGRAFIQAVPCVALGRLRRGLLQE